MRVVWMWAFWKVEVNNSANEEVARQHAQRRAKILVALGDCAVFGGMPAMRELLAAWKQPSNVRMWKQKATNQELISPTIQELATMTEARALHDVVPVDYNVPGCPPDADTIFYVLAELAQGRKPELKDEYLHWH